VSSEKGGLKEEKLDGLDQQNQPLLQPVLHENNEVEHASLHIEQQHQPDVSNKACGVVPWSIDWLSKLPYDNGNVPSNIFFAVTSDVAEICKEQPCASLNVLPKEKKEGYTKHSVGFIKRVARMLTNERKEIINFLKKHDRSRMVRKGIQISSKVGKSISESSKNSSSSVNKDWENWVFLHGKPSAVVEDVRDIGKAVGVSFKCDTSNNFNLLTREGRKGWRVVGGGEVGHEGAWVSEGVGSGC